MGISIGAGAAVIGASYGVYAGEEGRKVQKRGLRNQEQAQSQAESSALRQQRTSEEAYRAANRREPDVAGLLSDAQGLAAPPSMLTGVYGVNPSRLRLGRTSLLGE